MEQVISQSVPESLSRFMRERCRLPAAALHPLAESRLPEPARQLLAHSQDMTSTLAAFHESPLRVEILQSERHPELYVREVFLRTVRADAIVEYGVIGIALEPFTLAQQQAIENGEAPLGALLHRFKIPFTSAPIGFFSIDAEALAGTRLVLPKNAVCFGRFNRLSHVTGDPLAWILEILPPGDRRPE